MSDGSTHLAIGEVLKLLTLDFPDITISKIRFLESQGLINPERTASGYRKFYQDDIRRLEWVLRQQKERFLPLKVIKEKLDAGEDRADSLQPTLFGDAEPPPPLLGDRTPVSVPVADRPPSPPPVVDAAASGAEAAADAEAPPSELPRSTDIEAGAAAGAPPAPAPRHPASGHTLPSGDAPRAESPTPDPAAWLAALQEGPRRPAASRPVEPVFQLTADSSGDTFTRDELATAAGIPEEIVDALVEFGLIRSRVVGGETRYDAAAVEVARAGGAFIDKGIEVRHLRGYKLLVEREVTLFEQLTMPLLRQRNPSSRQQAIDELAALVGLGAALRAAMLRQALGPHVRPQGPARRPG